MAAAIIACASASCVGSSGPQTPRGADGGDEDSGAGSPSADADIGFDSTSPSAMDAQAYDAAVVIDGVATWCADSTAAPIGRTSFSAVYGPDRRIYVLGGTNNGNDVLAYDLDSKCWTREPPMLEQHAGYGFGAAVEPDGTLYAFGDGGSDFGYAESLAPRTTAWEPIAPMPTPRTAFAAARGADGLIYTIGGWGCCDWNCCYCTIGALEAFDPIAQRWSSLPPIPTPRGLLAAATALDGRIIAFGGDIGSSTTVSVYNPRSAQWTQGMPMPARPLGYYNLSAVTGANGRIFVLGGKTLEVDVYDPQLDQWFTSPPMPGPMRSCSVAVGGPDGRLYVIGKDNAAYPYCDLEIIVFDPNTSQWANEPS
jgi:N-acetylneuraminic acid mutarotase